VADGATGAREAAVALLEGLPKRAEEEPVVLSSMEEFVQRARAAPVRRLPSDDERYDEAFPDHPLSKVRALQAHILGSLVVEPWLTAAPRYRF
jgi:hypothetical protein